MKKIIWKILEKIDNNWGYSTPIQKRFKRGDIVKISIFKQDDTPYNIGEEVIILETSRHDYLVCDFKKGLKKCVYQFELDKI